MQQLLLVARHHRVPGLASLGGCHLHLAVAMKEKCHVKSETERCSIFWLGLLCTVLRNSVVELQQIVGYELANTIIVNQ
jgi:hypothetical protein